MNARSHTRHVVDQFGAQASAYVTSAVHAAGADLDRIGERVRARPGLRVLDLGCGGGHVAFAAAAAGACVTAYDLSAEMLAAVAAEASRRGLDRIETRQGGAEALPFPDARFDAVLTRYSAHHWRDVPAALAEARRVLKPDGFLVVSDIVAPEDPLLDTHLQAVELLRDPRTCATTESRNGGPCWRRPASSPATRRRAGRAWSSRAGSPGCGRRRPTSRRSGRCRSRRPRRSRRISASRPTAASCSMPR